MSAPARPSGSRAWLFGPSRDLLLGYGVLYLLTIPALVVLTRRTGFSSWPVWMTALIALAVSTPHYGATLVRVYERRSDRQRYAFFTVYVTLGLVLAFGAGLYLPIIGSLLITAYVSWSPWHFAGQNYGLAMMALGRRRIPVDDRTKKLLYRSFFLSFLLALLGLNMASSQLVFAQGTVDRSSSFRVLQLGLPVSLVVPVGAALGLAYVTMLALAARRLARLAKPIELLPAALLVAMQALWFVVPVAWAMSGGGSLGLAFAAIWISAAHAVQYLWVTSYYAKVDEDSTRPMSFLTKSMLAGAAMSFTPLLLFVPGLLGSYAPFSAGVAAAWFATMNLQHFILDGAIWKLRDKRIAKLLLAQPDADGTAPNAIGLSGRHWLRPFVFALGLACFFYPFYLLGESWYGSRPDASLERIQGSVARLSFLGVDSDAVSANLAHHYLEAGLVPEGIEALRRTLRGNPARADLCVRLSQLLMEYESDDPASLKEALTLAQQASRLRGHQDPATLMLLARANDVNGRPARAERARQRASDVQRQ